MVYCRRSLSHFEVSFLSNKTNISPLLWVFLIAIFSTTFFGVSSSKIVLVKSYAMCDFLNSPFWSLSWAGPLSRSSTSFLVTFPFWILLRLAPHILLCLPLVGQSLAVLTLLIFRLSLWRGMVYTQICQLSGLYGFVALRKSGVALTFCDHNNITRVTVVDTRFNLFLHCRGRGMFVFRCVSPEADLPFVRCYQKVEYEPSL